MVTHPEQPVPVLDSLFDEESFPNIPYKLHLLQLEAISSHPIASYLREETNTQLITTSFQVVVESNKVSLHPAFLQTTPVPSASSHKTLSHTAFSCPIRQLHVVYLTLFSSNINEANKILEPNPHVSV